MEFIFTERFKKSYKKLSKNVQKALGKKLSLMSRNPYHPSFRTKKVQGANDIFECTVSMSVRMTWQYGDALIVLRVVQTSDS